MNLNKQQEVLPGGYVLSSAISKESVKSAIALVINSRVDRETLPHI